MTNVSGSGAEMLSTWSVKSPRRGDATAEYSGAKIRLYVKSTSSDVTGVPSDHLTPECSLNV